MAPGETFPPIPGGKTPDAKKESKMDVGATEKAIRLMQGKLVNDVWAGSTGYWILQSAINRLECSLRTYLTGRE